MHAASIYMMGLFSSERRHVENIEVLDEKIIYQSSCFIRVKQWIRGKHPELGAIVYGITGWETLVEKDVVRPKETFLIC